MSYSERRDGETIARGLEPIRRRLPAMNKFLKNLLHGQRVPVSQRVRGDYEKEYNRIKREVDKIVSKGLQRTRLFEQLYCVDSDGTLEFPGLAKTSGDPFARLKILALNPTFSIPPDFEMLHPECPSMGMVFECGLNGGNCSATDIFPLRFELDTNYCDNPFSVFPEFEGVFLKRYLSNFLKLGGDVLLVLGNSAFDIFASVRRLEEEDLGSENSHLNVYTERDIENRCRVRRIVIHAPHPAAFLEDRILDKDFEESLELARRMDDSFNLATHLAGIRLKHTDYWSSRVVQIYESMSDISVCSDTD